MAREEYESAKSRMAGLEEELRELLVPKDPDDERNVVIEIRAGVGGEESALFAHSLLPHVQYVRRVQALEGLHC